MSRLTVAAAVAAAALVPGAAAAQPPGEPGAGAPLALHAVDPRAVPALARPISLTLRRVPLDVALSAIAERADLPLTFSRDLLPRGRRVSLAADGMLAGDALRAVLRDAGLEILALPTGQVVVVRAGAAGAGRGAGAQPAARVRISGTVRSAASGEVVRYALVTAVPVEAAPAGGGAAINAQANADGAYFLRLAPGDYRLRVRALGFAPLDTALAVAASRTVDVALRAQTVTLARVTVEGDAERPSADPRAADMSVARLDLRTLRQAPAVLGEVDPIRSLTLLPGVSRTSDFNTAFNVRGGGADQNLILLDQSTIYNPAHVLGFLSVFNADAVDDVTLYKGAIPARFGGRLSSVVDVRQRAGNAARLGGSATVGLLASRVALEGPLPFAARGGRRASFLVAARRSYADLFTNLSDDPEVRASVAYFYDVNATATLPLGATGSLVASGYAGRDRFATATRFGAGWGNAAGALRWNQTFGRRLFSTVTAAASDYDYRLGFDVGTDPVSWVARIRSADLKADESLHLGTGQTLEFGAQATLHDFQPGSVRASEGTGVVPTRVEPRRAVTAAAYLGHQAELGTRVSVRYGVRASTFSRRGAATVYRYADGIPVRYDTTLGRSEPGRLVDSTRYGSGDAVSTYSALEPRASVRVGLGGESSVKASYARTRQYLHLASRTNAPTPLDVWEPAGPYLRPQDADQYALGYAATAGGGRYELSAEAYYKRLYRVIDFVDGVDVILNERLETAIVQGRGRAYGVELFARRRTGRTTGWVSYTLARAEQRFGERTGANTGINAGRYFRAPFDKTHDLSVVALRPVGRGWTLGATFALASGLPATYPVARYQIDGLLVSEFGPRNSARLPLYHRLDVSMTRAFRRGELQAGVFNAYNRFNAQSITFRQSEQNPLIAQAAQTSIFGVVPSVSYTRRF